MRTYEIYRVKERYEPFIIGREALLHELLKNTKFYKQDREMIYICEKLNQEEIHASIVVNLGKVFKEVEYSNGKFTLSHPVKGLIVLSFSPFSITVQCHGSRMLDLDFFVAVAETEDRFFAIRTEQGEWGWLKPVKQKDILSENATVFH